MLSYKLTIETKRSVFIDKKLNVNAYNIKAIIVQILNSNLSEYLLF